MTDRPTHLDENGYLRFSDTHQLVHRAVAELKVGRRLAPSEVVHHIDMDKRNNDPANLQVCRDQAEHERIHGGVYHPDRSVVGDLFLVFMLVVAMGAIFTILSVFGKSGDWHQLLCLIGPALIIFLILSPKRKMKE